MSGQVEELDVPHAVYNKLINNGITTVSAVMDELLSSKAPNKLESLTNAELVVLSRAIARHGEIERDTRVSDIASDAAVLEVCADPSGVNLQMLIRSIVLVYEAKYGVGHLVQPPKKLLDSGKCACGVDRVECMKHMPCRDQPE